METTSGSNPFTASMDTFIIWLCIQAAAVIFILFMWVVAANKVRKAEELAKDNAIKNAMIKERFEIDNYL